MHSNDKTSATPISLAKEIADMLETSVEYKEYQKYKEIINETPELSEKITAYRLAQIEFHSKVLNGEKTDVEEENALNNLYTSLKSDSRSRNFMIYEKALLNTLNEIYEIIGDAISIDIGF